ncbi:hypothetical protein RB195_019190 [Necator americanus]|uniref:Protein kinase domain-containing protein n=1 Tax=Necator americanus TaxID=51031 RepID=A0ABR1CD11_NECAM
MFPPEYIAAVKLSLLNEPIYHGKLTPEAVRAKLQKTGDFLVQDGEDGNSLLLSVLENGVRDFLITIEKTKEGHRFLVGKLSFRSLQELMFTMKSLQCGSETIKLEAAIYRTDDCGRFGAHCFVEEPPRTTMRTMIPLPTVKYKSAVVMVKEEIIHNGIEEELEALMLLKHRHLIQLEDFATYQYGPVILRYQNHDDIPLYDIMRKKEDIQTATVLKWIHQAATLAFYLAQKDCFCSILCAQDCYLDAGGDLKFRGAWNNSWPSWQEDTLRHSFYWRFVAPESLLLQTNSVSSVVWNLGVFMWQLTVNCLLMPFFQYQSRNSYLEGLCSGNLTLLDHEQNIDVVDLELLKRGIKVPESVESMISECVALQPDERCLWSTILNTTMRERAVTTIGGAVKQIFPFV